MGWAGLRLLPCPLELTISRILLYCRTSHSFDFSPAVKSGSDPSYHFPLPTFLRSDRENCLLVSDPRRKRRQTDRPDIVPDTSLSLSLSRARAHIPCSTKASQQNMPRDGGGEVRADGGMP